jgi:hypothetical protein
VKTGEENLQKSGRKGVKTGGLCARGWTWWGWGGRRGVKAKSGACGSDAKAHGQPQSGQPVARWVAEGVPPAIHVPATTHLLILRCMM